MPGSGRTTDLHQGQGNGGQPFWLPASSRNPYDAKPRRLPHAKPDKGSPAGPGGEILYYAWTVDGTEPTSQEDIFAVDTATGVVRRITDHAAGPVFTSDRDPSWSPDRTRIVLMRSDGLVRMHLVVLRADGTHLADLATEGIQPAGWTTPRCCAPSPGPAWTGPTAAPTSSPWTRGVHARHR